VRPDHADATPSSTGGISREHTIALSPSGLVTITGGKWTTYRAMAEDVLEKCVEHRLLPALPPSRTSDFPLLGAPSQAETLRPLSDGPGLHEYGTEADLVQSLPGADRFLAPGLSEAMVRFAARHEYARRVEDVLARRSRLLFLDAASAARHAGEVAQVLAEETGTDPYLDDFIGLARSYGTLAA